MREPDYYRQNIERLNCQYPKKDRLTILDVAEYNGVSVNTAKKRFPFIKRSEENPSGGCYKTTLARAMKGWKDMDGFYEKFKKYKVTADSLDDFFEKWHRPGSVTDFNREADYATHKAELEKDGYTWIPANDSITGQIVSYYEAEMEHCDA